MPFLIGDSPKIPFDLYDRHISLNDAQAMADLLCEALGVKPVKVQKGRKSITLHGSMDTRTRTMILNKPSEGVVIHELSHLFTRFGHHGFFKGIQEKVYKTWEGNSEED